MGILDKKIVYFLMVVEEGSFSAAARQLFLSQPALSKQMGRLEEELGFALFDRSGYRPLLTEKGQVFYRECVKLDQTCRELLAQVKQHDPLPVNIGFTGSFENREILSFLQQYRGRRGIAVNFLRGDFEQCLNDLVQGRTDVSFGIDSTFRYTPAVEYHILHPYEMCVITAPAHPLANRQSLSIQEIGGERFICLSSRFGRGFYRDFMAAFAKDGVIPAVVKEVDSFDELVFSVSLGEGISITSPHVVGEEIRAIPLKGSHHHSNYVIAHRKGEARPEVVRLVEAAKEYFRLRQGKEER